MFLDEKLTVTGLSVFQPGFEKRRRVFVPGRRHHSLSFRLSGSITIETEEKRMISDPGSLTFVPQDVSYHTEILENGYMIAVHFTTAEKYDELGCEVITPAYPMVFRNLFSELMQRFKLGRESDFYCLSMFYGILAEARHEVLESTPRRISPRMQQARSRIERGFSDPALTVARLAEEAGVSEVYFRREFGECFGMAPSAYIKNIRIENAKAYLRTGYYTVTETAMRCGFDSISYFSAEFHRHVGMTPREYILRHG